MPLRKELLQKLDNQSEIVQNLLAGQSYRSQGYDIRLAETLDDAHHISEMLRRAWGLGKLVHYFYEVFNNPEDILHAFLLSVSQANNFIDIQTLCFLATDHEQKPVGTVSLVFDHAERTVEFGRVATLPEKQNNGVLSAFAIPVHETSTLFPDYTLVSDSTTLTLAIQRFLSTIDTPALALHPSSFVIQQDVVLDWNAHIGKKFNASIAQAMLSTDSDSGLGRFATFFHEKPGTHEYINPPHDMTDAQKPFFLYSTEQLKEIGRAVDTKKSRQYFFREMSIHENSVTHTRVVSDVLGVEMLKELLDEESVFETTIFQIPCMKDFRQISLYLESMGAILSGVFPKHGCWYASYTWIHGKHHRDKAKDGLILLEKQKSPTIAFGDSGKLLQLLANSIL
ncbi:MAG: hypothetical protein HZA34_01115 [Candidatus Pacebacteria bacterium]|nr:hypothetical protein [Candidatus Paceibacterota bacterium]